MKIGIIVTDDEDIWGAEQGVGEYFVHRFKREHQSLFSPREEDSFILFPAVSGRLPNKDEIRNFDALIFTGSHYSVNMDKTWIRRLETFVREAYEISLTFDRPRIVGICFGHQLIAKSLGGLVAKNPDGQFNFGSTNVCVQEYFLANEFSKQICFKNRENSTITLMKFHGECVVKLPKIATLVGWSQQCQCEILMYGKNVLTFQGHPEYTKKTMIEINSKIMQRIGRLTESEIKQNLQLINEDDVDCCLELVRSFIKN